MRLFGAQHGPVDDHGALEIRAGSAHVADLALGQNGALFGPDCAGVGPAVLAATNEVGVDDQVLDLEVLLMLDPLAFFKGFDQFRLEVPKARPQGQKVV